jgi:hypothetical protein
MRRRFQIGVCAERIVHLFSVIVALLASLGSHVPRVLAADGPREGGFVRPREIRAKRESQRSERVARQAAAESEALYQFMLAEDRAAANVAKRDSSAPPPNAR